MKGYGAIIDETGAYRYVLSRSWGNGKVMTWVMLNPSTADASTDDPTIRRCMTFAKSWGFAGLEVVNLFAFRATKPSALKTAKDPIGPQNGRYVTDAMLNKLVVVAWGCSPLPIPESILSIVSRWSPMCLGTTKAGHPRHPLYVRGDTVLQPFIVGVHHG